MLQRNHPDRITAMPVESVDRSTLQEFVYRHTLADTIVYTDESSRLRGVEAPAQGRQPLGQGVPLTGWPTRTVWSRSGRC